MRANTIRIRPASNSSPAACDGPGTQVGRGRDELHNGGVDGADEYRLIIRAREDLEKGRDFRQVTAGPGFTRKVLEAVEQEGGRAQRHPDGDDRRDPRRCGHPRRDRDGDRDRQPRWGFNWIRSRRRSMPGCDEHARVGCVPEHRHPRLEDHSTTDPTGDDVSDRSDYNEANRPGLVRGGRCGDGAPRRGGDAIDRFGFTRWGVPRGGRVKLWQRSSRAWTSRAWRESRSSSARPRARQGEHSLRSGSRDRRSGGVPTFRGSRHRLGDEPRYVGMRLIQSRDGGKQAQIKSLSVALAAPAGGR